MKRILPSLPDIKQLVMMDRPETMPADALIWTDLLQQGEAALAENPSRLAELQRFLNDGASCRIPSPRPLRLYLQRPAAAERSHHVAA